MAGMNDRLKAIVPQKALHVLCWFHDFSDNACVFTHMFVFVSARRLGEWSCSSAACTGTARELCLSSCAQCSTAMSRAFGKDRQRDARDEQSSKRLAYLCSVNVWFGSTRTRPKRKTSLGRIAHHSCRVYSRAWDQLCPFLNAERLAYTHLYSLCRQRWKDVTLEMYRFDSVCVLLEQDSVLVKYVLEWIWW